MARELLSIRGENPKRPEQRRINDFVSHLGAERAYWPRLEEPFKRFMEDLARDRNEYGEYGDEHAPGVEDNPARHSTGCVQ